MKLQNKGNIPINGVIWFAIAIFVAIVILSLVLPMLISVESSGPCAGPNKAVASVLADMTGVDMC